jgi:hypothetical protein
MPMSFPNMDSLKRHATMLKFRQPNKDESEDDYREALANHVQPIDFIESCEIRNKVGWDQWSEEQNRDMLRRRGFPI